MMECTCCFTDVEDNLRTLKAFEVVRANCPALREILIPDDIWNDYKTFCLAEPDQACHQPLTYLAFKRGYLARVTEPIHRFCLDGDELNERLKKQYKNDLKEKWFMKDDEKERFKRNRGYTGRIAELSFALWLEKDGWKIDDLEAYNASVDIGAISKGGCTTSFEVKHLGREETNFEISLRALKSPTGVAYGRPSVYSAMDYLLYRVYEAAKQLAKVNSKKVVVAILEDFNLYKRPLKEKWIDWKNPEFLRRDKNIDCFLEKKYRENSELDEEILDYVSQLDEIWFFAESALTLENVDRFISSDWTDKKSDELALQRR